MPILLDHQLQEQIPHGILDFPIAFYCDELATLPNCAGPVHWHPYFEIATAQSGVLDYQVGQIHTILEPGDRIFVNQNTLHGIRQLSDGAPDHLPIILFSGTVIAPENSVIYQKYIQPILACNSLPFVVLRHDSNLWEEVRRQISAIYCVIQEQPDCYELAVQRNICCVVEAIFRNFDSLPKSEASRVQLNTQIRLQKMLSYIYENYAQTVTLADIAGSANISRSEAGRCFQSFMGCSPVEALIQYRLQTAQRLLRETTLTLQEISFSCGFHSVNYFSRQFRKRYGYSPGAKRKQKLGK